MLLPLISGVKYIYTMVHHQCIHVLFRSTKPWVGMATFLDGISVCHQGVTHVNFWDPFLLAAC